MKRMFKSIGLNIDQPETFFVQQGKITRIVNFKPIEVMNMLMESAGVADYQEVSGQTRVVLKNKSEKLEVNSQRIQANFGPKLEMLQKERARADQFEYLKKHMDEKAVLVDKINKYNHVKAVITCRKRISEMEFSISNLKTLLKQHQLELESLKGKQDGSSMGSSDSRSVQADISKLVQKKQNVLNLASEAKVEIESHLKKLVQKTEAIETNQKKVNHMKSSMGELKMKIENYSQQLARTKEAVAAADHEKKELNLKMMAKDGSGVKDPAGPIEHRIKQLENEASIVDDGIENMEKKMKRMKEELKNTAEKKHKFDKEQADVERDVEALEKDVAKYVKMVLLMMMMCRMMNCCS